MIEASVSSIDMASQVSYLPTVKLKLISHRIQVIEIITKAITKQINLLENENALPHTIKKHLSNQYHTSANSRSLIDTKATSVVDTDIEVNRAIKAFKKGFFKMFVDGYLVTDPNEYVLLTDESQINFIRLVQLEGG